MAEFSAALRNEESLLSTPEKAYGDLLVISKALCSAQTRRASGGSEVKKSCEGPLADARASVRCGKLPNVARSSSLTTCAVKILTKA